MLILLLSNASQSLVANSDVILVLPYFPGYMDFPSGPTDDHKLIRYPSGTVPGSRSIREESCTDAVVLPALHSPAGPIGDRGHNDDDDHNMLDRITDDLNFLLNGTTQDMMTFTPAHQLTAGKQKLATIQENMVGISEEFELRPTIPNQVE